MFLHYLVKFVSFVHLGLYVSFLYDSLTHRTYSAFISYSFHAFYTYFIDDKNQIINRSC